MLGTLLINQINYRNKERVRKMFFLIGNMSLVKDEILDAYNRGGAGEGIILNYNGVTISMKTEDIPKAIEYLTKKGAEIYAVYEIYEPY